jgi:urea transport system substrate-binding protein
VDKVRDVLESGSITFDGPGGKTTMQKNHHTINNVYIGETRANGQFKIVKEFNDVAGEPFILKGLDDKLAAK